MNANVRVEPPFFSAFPISIFAERPSHSTSTFAGPRNAFGTLIPSTTSLHLSAQTSLSPLSPLAVPFNVTTPCPPPPCPPGYLLDRIGKALLAGLSSH